MLETLTCDTGSRAGVRLDVSIVQSGMGLVVYWAVRLLEATN